MKVWVVEFSMPYEGSILEGIFSTKESAIQYVKTKTSKPIEDIASDYIRGSDDNDYNEYIISEEEVDEKIKRND
jgi:hypothetical protein